MRRRQQLREGKCKRNRALRGSSGKRSEEGESPPMFGGGTDQLETRKLEAGESPPMFGGDTAQVATRILEAGESPPMCDLLGKAGGVGGVLLRAE